MEKVKYYTPEISEFFVRFSYEWLFSLKQNVIKGEDTSFEEWQSCVYGEDNHLNHWVTKANINKGLCRVKHLDKKDIVSLGWEDGNDFGMSCFIYGEFQLCYQFDNQFAQIYNDDAKIIFEGTINNINELQKLMKKLYIYID